MATEAEILAKMKELEKRIKAPSIWGRVACGLRFEDLQDRRYEAAVKFLKKHYLPEEITYRSVKITEDKEGTDEFIHNARIWMKDKMSIAVVKEGEDKLVGLLIMRIQEKSAYSRTFSRVKLTYNPAYTTVMTFYNVLEKKVNIYKEMGVKKYFKIYVIALKNRYRHRGIGKELMKAAINLSTNANVAALSGIFTTSKLQEMAGELGFKKLTEIYYIRYLINDEVVFWDSGKGNYGAALMACKLPDVEEIEVEPQHSSRFALSIQNLEIEDEELEGEEEQGEEERTEDSPD